MKIEVFGPGCASCRKSYETVRGFVEARGLPAEIVKVEGLDDIAARGILRTPAVVIDGVKLVEGRVLRERDLEKAIDRMNILSAGWGGGTRLGASLRTFNDNYAKQVLTARSVVMILSDGYDTGEPEDLGRELERLGKRARRVVWLNPLLGWEGYEPVAQGMAAALPHIDLFAPAHNLESLAALEPYLCKL